MKGYFCKFIEKSLKAESPKAFGEEVLRVTSPAEARILSARMNFAYDSGRKTSGNPIARCETTAQAFRAIRPDENPSVRTKSFPKCRVFAGARPPVLMEIRVIRRVRKVRLFVTVRLDAFLLSKFFTFRARLVVE